MCCPLCKPNQTPHLTLLVAESCKETNVSGGILELIALYDLPPMLHLTSFFTCQTRVWQLYFIQLTPLSPQNKDYTKPESLRQIWTYPYGYTTLNLFFGFPVSKILLDLEMPNKYLAGKIVSRLWSLIPDATITAALFAEKITLPGSSDGISRFQIYFNIFRVPTCMLTTLDGPSAGSPTETLL
jgi:hypothetical protein